MSRVVVVGGGFAGMAAACRLAGDGHRPLLLERAARLGGRAASFYDRRSGETIDYAEHVLMACCSASRGFLERIGASDAVRFQPSLRIPLLCEGRTTKLRSSILPGPLHLAPSLLAYHPLTMRDRHDVLRAGAALWLQRSRGDESLGAWLDRYDQSESAMSRLWDPICIATLNAPAERVCRSAARQVFREAFFVPGGANLGLFVRPFSAILDRARAYLECRDGTVRIRAAVKRVLIDGAAVRGVELADGERVEADAVVIAVPPDAFAELIDEDPGLTRVAQRAVNLAWSPIADVHLWFDRPVMREAFAIALDAPIQTIFRAGRQLNDPFERDGRSAHIVVSQSAADDWMALPSGEIGSLVTDAVRDLLPEARDATCLRTLVIKHRRATFVPAPGSERLRPGALTPVRGLFLAGDWIGTGWPSTIESAIRSGVVAAAHVETCLESEERDPRK